MGKRHRIECARMLQGEYLFMTRDELSETAAHYGEQPFQIA